MFCHGYVASYYFDSNDTLAPKRAAFASAVRRSTEPQRKWFARAIIRATEKGLRRKEAQTLVEQYVVDASKRVDRPKDAAWFKRMMTGNGLATTYDEKKFSLKEMRKLAAEPPDDLPPIPDLKVP